MSFFVLSTMLRKGSSGGVPTVWGWSPDLAAAGWLSGRGHGFSARQGEVSGTDPESAHATDQEIDGGPDMMTFCPI